MLSVLDAEFLFLGVVIQVCVFEADCLSTTHFRNIDNSDSIDFSKDCTHSNCFSLIIRFSEFSL